MAPCPNCRAKAGRCGTCDATCRRCGCACDGVPVEVKLARKRGRQPKEAAPAPGPAARRRRVAAASAAQSIADATQAPGSESESETVPVHVPLLDKRATRRDLFTAMGLNPRDAAKKLPASRQGASPTQATPAQRRFVINRLYDLTKRALEIMAPGMEDEDMLAEVVAKFNCGKGSGSDGRCFQTLAENMGKAVHLGARGSIPVRVCRAMLSQSLSPSARKDISAKTGVNFHNGGAMGAQCRQDFAILTTPGAAQEGLPETTHSYARFEKDAVTEAVKFMLSERNVGTLSWGTRVVPMKDRTIVRLPTLTRRRQFRSVFTDYSNFCGGTPKIGKTSFRELMNAVTFGEERLLCAVDYVVGMLINDACDKVQRLIEDFANADRDTLTKHLAKARNFLKVQFDDHVKKHDGSARHSCSFGLQMPHVGSAARPETCAACKYPFWVLEEVRKVVKPSERKSGEAKKSALAVLASIEEKFELFMRHRVRVVNQQTKLDAILAEMEQECVKNKTSSRAHVVMDWKMELMPRSARKTTQEHFGKHGTSWHGFLIYVFEYDEATGTARQQTFYTDQIGSGENKQDAAATSSMLEAFLWQLAHELPWVKEISLQSDNALCYQNHNMLLFILLLNCTHKIKIIRYIHTEAQDGKCPIDAHFAHGTHQVTRYLKAFESNKLRNVATASGLAHVLAWNGGIQNSLVQLVAYNRPKLDKLMAFLKPIAEEARGYFSRASDVFFEEPAEGWSNVGKSTDFTSVEGIGACKASFKVRVFAYSGIGDGVPFTVRFATAPLGSDNTTRRFSRAADLANPAPDLDQDEDQDQEPVEDDKGEDGDGDGENRSELESTAEWQAQGDGEESGDEGADNSDVWSEPVYNGTYVERDQRLCEGFVTGARIIRSSGFGSCAQRKKSSDVKKCKSPKEATETNLRDLVSFGITAARDFCLHHNDFSEQEMPEYELATHFETKPLAPGWARRPRKGEHYGQSYMDEYRQDIKDMFEKGRDNDSEKMNSSMMLDELRRKYPDRYTLPGEIEIRRAINSLFQQQKGEEAAKKRRLAKGGTSGGSKRFAWPKEYVTMLQELREACSEPPGARGRNKRIAAQFMATVRAEDGTLPSDVPSEAKIESKVAALATAERKDKVL